MNFGHEREDFDEWVDDRLDAVIATDEYIEDMENKIDTLKELRAEAIDELKDDEDNYMSDFEGSADRYNKYPASYM